MTKLNLPLVLMVFLAVPNAFADANRGERPNDLSCNVIGAPEGVVQKFKLSKFNTLKPSSTLPDAGLMDPINETELKETGVLAAPFSNECDNFYQVKFLEQNLVDLQSKKITEVTGTLEGFTAETDTENQFKLTIRCELPKSE